MHGHIKKLVEEYFETDSEAVLADPILFGDYRAAREECEQRVYEDIGDYDVSKAIFQVMHMILFSISHFSSGLYFYLSAVYTAGHP